MMTLDQLAGVRSTSSEKGQKKQTLVHAIARIAARKKKGAGLFVECEKAVVQAREAAAAPAAKNLPRISAGSVKKQMAW